MPAPQDSDAQAEAQERQWKESDITVTDPGTMRRAVGAAAIGNVTEWFDFGVYGYLQTTIEGVFFPASASPAVKTLGTLGIFAVAFLVRPFGGLFFGPLGDRIGRTKVLSLTVILMAISTFAIGFLPDYETIGPAAPMLMLLLRLTQGFSTGGEYGGAMTFIAEYAPDKRRGFLGSWLEFGTLTGYALGASLSLLLMAVLSPEAMDSWGWRIPFLIAGPLGVFGLYLRMKLEETPAFKQIATESEGREGNQTLTEMRRIFVKNWRAMLTAGGLVLVFNVTNYMLTEYVTKYLTTLHDYKVPSVSETTGKLLEIGVLVAMIVLITFVGRLSDRIGRRPIIWIGCILLIVASVPSVLLLQSGSVVGIFGGLLLMGAMLLCFNSTMPSTLPALFPTDVRYGALSIAFNVSVSLFGGTVGFVVSALIIASGDLNFPAYYLIGAGVIGAISVALTKESARRPLPGSAPAVGSQEEARELAAASNRS